MRSIRLSVIPLLFVTLIGASALGGAAWAQGEQTVTLRSLLEEMVDREVLARWPDRPYTCKQASSYDRDSNDPNNPDTWYANWDRSQFVRIDEHPDGRKEHVLMDETGPGALVRFWATWHGPGGGEFSNGTMRIYLDGNATPAIEGPIRDLISGGALVGAPLSDFVSKTCPVGQRAHNLYLPIPYAKGCKITYETDVLLDRGGRNGEALYYQINYRTYEPGTKVESFSKDVLERERATVDRIQALLQKPGAQPLDTNAAKLGLAGPLKPGEAREAKLTGPAAIRELRLKLSADDPVKALRSTVLEIAFDGERTVWCPVGDFFGASYDPQPFETWFTSADEKGTMAARWVMPFGESAVIRIHNLGEESVELDLVEADTTTWQWDERSMHFSAAWHEHVQYATTRTDMSGRNGPKDENYVTIKGQGVFVGDTLTLFDGDRAWWGEGDEKIYVDGEDFPSHFGTGTEDYYGYAWCRGEYFCMPFHAQPIGTGNLDVGPAVNSRYRTLDAIPFEKSFRFDMEIWSWASTKINYAPATFWYARPGAVRNIEPMPERAAAGIAQELDDVIPVYREKGAIEGETLAVTRRTGGMTELQNMAWLGWSNNQHLWWRNGQVGDELDITFSVEQAGTYNVTARLTTAVDYGVFSLLLNGETAKDDVDLYSDGVKQRIVDLGTHELKAGEHTFTARITGANEKAVKNYMFGLDYLKLEQASE